MSELYRILSNNSENPRAHLGFVDHRYFHAWAAGRARLATGLFLRAQRSAGAWVEPRGAERRGERRGAATRQTHSSRFPVQGWGVVCG